MESTVSVQLSGNRSYLIRIGPGLFGRVGEPGFPYRRIVAFVDARVQRSAPEWVARVVAAAGQGGAEVDCFPIRVAETRKNLRSVESVLACLHGLDRVDRHTVLMAIGGGVLGDLVGFAAAIWLRGLPFVQVPTTLLAMVDSSVGGKTGVDFGMGKNLVGAFHQPQSVWIDTDVLRSLPVSEFRSGLAEVVKYGVIREPGLLDQLDSLSVSALRRDPGLALPLIELSCRIKADVVAGDEREESGLRAILNFGHTIGHALEGLTGYRRYRHGEAVAIGMVSAACIGEAIGFSDSGVLKRLLGVLERLELPRWLPEDIGDDALLSASARDKKSIGASLRFVLARELGSVELVPVDPAVVCRGLALHRALVPGGAR